MTDKKIYAAWSRMKSRCRDGGSYQKAKPSYIGCTVSESFKDFSNFSKWYREQIGYLEIGYHLDKDILKGGNKVYCEEHCVLVPSQLNTFFVSCLRSRGKYPQGVSYHIKAKVYCANIRTDGIKKHIGSFNTAESASLAYIAAKEDEAYRWYERLCNGEFIVDPRVIERMRTWTLGTQ